MLIKPTAIFPKQDHASRRVELSKQETIDLPSRKMYNEPQLVVIPPPRAKSPGQPWRGYTKPKTRAHPQGPVPLLTPYVPRRLNVPLHAEIMKITNSRSGVRACTDVCAAPRGRTEQNSTSKVFLPLPSEAGPRTPWTYRKLSTVIFGQGGAAGSEDRRKRAIAWNTFEVPISRLAADRSSGLISWNCEVLPPRRFVSLSRDKCLAS